MKPQYNKEASKQSIVMPCERAKPTSDYAGCGGEKRRKHLGTQTPGSCLSCLAEDKSSPEESSEGKIFIKEWMKAWKGMLYIYI